MRYIREMNKNIYDDHCHSERILGVQDRMLVFLEISLDPEIDPSAVHKTIKIAKRRYQRLIS